MNFQGLETEAWTVALTFDPFCSTMVNLISKGSEVPVKKTPHHIHFNCQSIVH